MLKPTEISFSQSEYFKYYVKQWGNIYLTNAYKVYTVLSALKLLIVQELYKVGTVTPILQMSKLRHSDELVHDHTELLNTVFVTLEENGDNNILEKVIEMCR